MTTVLAPFVILFALAGIGAAVDSPARYLALGDSYTIGEGVGEDGRWPVQLAAALNAAGVPCAPPRIIARTGWTTDELMAAVDTVIPPDRPQPVYDLVTLLIGVNDQFRGRTTDDFAKTFPLCRDRAVALAGGRRERVVVVAIPDYGFTPFGRMINQSVISHGIDTFDAVVRNQTPAPIGYADILPVSRQVQEHKDWVGGDGLHPTPVQYAAWTAVILPLAKAALTAKPADATSATPAP